ncbi:TlpA family protein disulfide reductase [Aureivirga marina]|uniref:TlpA family protein disulfide reductase n=1 Tax=Aureivirga marina TaxID=1182451 RepID=UPI0018C9B9CC|nr:hypothetical protein [Aureivirga marina]
MKQFLLIIFTAIIAIGCQTTKRDDYAYFGGRIINPKSNYVILSKDKLIIDTIYLNKNNQFLTKLQTPQEGLYKFRHGNEFQYVFIQPFDSILVRLNTWNFDKSLVYTGKGSSKNEFLINALINDEKDYKNLYPYFHLNSKQFAKKVDSIVNRNNKNYEIFITQNPDVSPLFLRYAKAAISYPPARVKEIYPLLHKKRLRLDNFETIQDDFYAFRSELNINDSFLNDFYPFTNYVVTHLYNEAYNQKFKGGKQSVTSNMLHLVHDNINKEEFRNKLLRKVIYDDFKSETSCGISDKEYNLFQKFCSNPKFQTEVKKLYDDSRKVIHQQPLSNFDVVNLTGDSKHIKQLIKNKNTVIYFWSDNYLSPEYLYKRVSFLEKKHPNFTFIGINTQSNHDIIENTFVKKIDSKNQYQLTEKSIAHSYVTSNYPRTIIINKNGVVENGFANLSSNKLSEQLNKVDKN